MLTPWQVISYVATAAAAILVYEVLRAWFKRWLKRRLERDLGCFLASPDLYAQHFKFTNKFVVKSRLLSDPEIHATMAQYARREGVDPIAVRQKVEAYVEEIVPSFNLLSYYKVGYTVARAFIHSLYDPVVDQEKRKLLDTVPSNASPVYVMNHRSNVDFVLLAYVLAGRVSVSYAVGEWARVWPLEHLFKSFGSYLVRRGHKEDLYHKVLERYVQLQARHGVAQAIFPEGQITRDGRLLPPKFGLLQFLAGVEAEPTPERELTFIPVGVNYDWVLEDRNLVGESEGRPPKQGLAKRVQVIVTGPFIFFAVLVANGVRWAMGRLKLHGYASLSFGAPVSMRAWMKERGVDLTTLDYAHRKPHVQAFGEDLLRRIGQAVPATPATILAVALLDHPQESYDRGELVRFVSAARDELESKGVRVVVGRDFQKIRHALALAQDTVEQRPELGDVDRTFLRQEEAERLVRFGTDVLRRNKILRRKARRWTVRPNANGFLRYYANSLAHHLGREYPIAARTPST